MTLQALCQSIGSLTRPVLYHSETVLYTSTVGTATDTRDPGFSIALK